MKNKKQNAKTLAILIEEKISTPIYDALIDLYNIDAERRNNGESDPIKSRQEIVIASIEDALNSIEDYNDHDLSDLSSINFDYARDTIAHEYADNEAEIYNYWLWKHAPILSNFIEDSISEYGSESIKDGGLIKIFQLGEYYFYSQFINEVINALEEIKDDQE